MIKSGAISVGEDNTRVTVFLLLLSMATFLPLVVTAQEGGTQVPSPKPHYKANYSDSGMVITQNGKNVPSESTANKHSNKTTDANDLNSRGRSANVRIVESRSTQSHMLDNNSLGQQSESSPSVAISDNDDQLKVYQYKQTNGVTAFADHAPGSSEYQVLLYDCYACRPDSDLDWRRMPLFSDDYDELIGRAAKEHQVEPALIRAVIHAESAFNVFALSRTGAMGLMQLMPDTAKELGVSNAFRPDQNIDGGAKYLSQMLKRFNGDVELACAAYNAGPTTVTNYNGIPPYPETQAYVKRVQILLKRYRKS